MNKKVTRNIQLGIFLIVGTILFIAIIYYLGSRQNLFGSSTRIFAIFNDVSGLKEGNNVRFAGINVGTVEEIDIISDSTVKVTMLIDESASQYIKEDSKATIESEGLMGSKIVSITSGSTAAPSIDEGDQLTSINPVDIDEIIGIVEETGEQALAFTKDLSMISERIKSGRGLLGSLIADSSMENQVNDMMNTFDVAGKNVLAASKDISSLTDRLQEGKGTLGELIYDDHIVTQFRDVADSLEITSHYAKELSKSLANFAEKLNNQESVLSKILSDTAMAETFGETLSNVNEAAAELDVTAEKINNSWILNGLFGGKRDKKEKKK